MIRLLLSTLTSPKMIRHCDHEERSGKQSDAYHKIQIIQLHCDDSLSERKSGRNEVGSNLFTFD
ncbi:MAG: hypothetical protein M1445_16615 [Bacteroidetes bacterium]|nr:hypothetical protein [Bacteroidota bacterium]MCL6102479.1 hypothetical protein [Bacteroidota bacterium]